MLTGANRINNPLAPQQALEGLTNALRESGLFNSSLIDCQLLADKGLAHWHARIVLNGAPSAWLARVPKQSQMQLLPSLNLAYQEACFSRAAASQHTPKLLSCLAPQAQLPWGAVIVEMIDGRNAQLPDDLHLIAQALAALHRLNLPVSTAPLLNEADPLSAMLLELRTQALVLDKATLNPTSRLRINFELARFALLCESSARPARCLISFDTHPGNFLLRQANSGENQAVLVDLEKCRYSYAGFDLAHASVYTSTTWDIATRCELSQPQVLAFYNAWASAAPLLAQSAAAWHAPLRRAMSLWAITWCAQWRVGHNAQLQHATAASSSHLLDHVRERVDHYLSASVIDRLFDECDALESVMADASGSTTRHA